MARLICRLFGHAEATYHFGTTESGCILKRCMRCHQGRVHAKWNVPVLDEWPTYYVSQDEMREFISRFAND